MRIGFAIALAALLTPAGCGRTSRPDGGNECLLTCVIGTVQCVGAERGICTYLGGCNSYVATPCPTGESCNAATGQCAPDPCAPAAVVAACTSAASNLNQCCNENLTAVAVCESQVDAGHDPLTGCSNVQNISCSTLHDDFQAAASCCCPAGLFCDGFLAGACAQACVKPSDCLTGAACAPATGSGGIPQTGFPYICRPNSRTAYSGCKGAVSCGAGYCCVTDANGNEFCALPCTDSTACAGGACNTYDFSHGTCSGPKACGP
jgi:hypothetical protein